MIRLDKLSLSFEDRPILNQVSFEVPRGKTLALIGESGGGKTSIARLLLGLVDGQRVHRYGSGCKSSKGGFQWSGDAWVGGLDVLRATSPQLRAFRGRKIGLIVQGLSDALNPHLTVLEHIDEMLKVHRIAEIDARQACSAYNLPKELLHRFPAGLSGGEVQRLLTALALIGKPEYLVLDEPTASLDPISRELAIQSFAVGRDERCQLLITHDLDLARRMADSVGVLYKGRLIEIGPTSRILTRPAEAYTRSLLNADTHMRPSGSKQYLTAFESSNPVVNNVSKSADTVEVTSKSRQVSRKAGILVSDLSHGFGGTQVLRNISVFVPKGTCFAILGPSGCGKSTFARLIAGYESVQSGEVGWCSSLPESLKETSERSTVIKKADASTSALVSQHPHRAMARHFSVAQVLQEALLLRRAVGQLKPAEYAEANRAALKALLDGVGLPTDSEFLGRRTAALSGGEAQRLVIARALATKPRYLVADEPTSALDIHSRAQVLDLLCELKQQQGLTIVLFTHDPVAAQYLGDDTVRLVGGKLTAF